MTFPAAITLNLSTQSNLGFKNKHTVFKEGMSALKSVKGMKDILPEVSHYWSQVERAFAEVFARFGYRCIRTPILESTNLFFRSIGEETDIVAKEMYTFEDRSGVSVTLRPEGTASCVRAGIEHGLFYNQQQRLWYAGPMFRYERPQKGRYRQFYQVGVECFGWHDIDIEAEVFSMTQQLFQQLGLQNTTLQINSLGDAVSRKQYREVLVEYLSQHKDKLDADSQRRLSSNPLRILDSKNPEVQAILDHAPNVLDSLSADSAERFARLQDTLQAMGVDYSLNQRLVRGLDYYNDTVFEWVNEGYGAQSTVCGGGRYDNLVEQLGGQPTPAFGFGLGQERLIEMLLEQSCSALDEAKPPQVFIISVGSLARTQALCLQATLTGMDIATQCFMGEGSIKNQFKRADKSGALLGLIIGESEAERGEVGVKFLRREHAEQCCETGQEQVLQTDVLNAVTKRLKSL